MRKNCPTILSRVEWFQAFSLACIAWGMCFIQTGCHAKIINLPRLLIKTWRSRVAPLPPNYHMIIDISERKSEFPFSTWDNIATCCCSFPAWKCGGGGRGTRSIHDGGPMELYIAKPNKNMTLKFYTHKSTWHQHFLPKNKW